MLHYSVIWILTACSLHLLLCQQSVTSLDTEAGPACTWPRYSWRMESSAEESVMPIDGRTAVESVRLNSVCP